MKFKIGMEESLTKTISEMDVSLMADITGDSNPIHLDEDYAKDTIFGKRIVHGVFCNGLISAVLGTKLPGPGSIYQKQEINWLKPVFLGDTLTATAKIYAIEKKDKNRKIHLDTVCVNQHGETVASGYALIIFP